MNDFQIIAQAPWPLQNVQGTRSYSNEETVCYLLRNVFQIIAHVQQFSSTVCHLQRGVFQIIVHAPWPSQEMFRSYSNEEKLHHLKRNIPQLIAHAHWPLQECSVHIQTRKDFDICITNKFVQLIAHAHWPHQECSGHIQKIPHRATFAAAWE